jgi:hypothetical protein
MSKLHLFYGGPFSQWYRSKFEIDGVIYNCAEQYMMAEKAKLFEDMDVHTKIMASTDPSEQKALGKQVKFFEVNRWNKVAKDIVYQANIAKFNQDPKLKTFILGTGDDTLVEASPTDKIWGIGLAQNDPRAQDPKQWQGTNWLGIVLMRVRKSIYDKN